MMTKTIKWTLQLVNEPNLLKESNTGFILISQKFPDNLCKTFAMSKGLTFQIGAIFGRQSTDYIHYRIISSINQNRKYTYTRT